MNEFATTFNRLLAVSGKSLNQIAELSGLDRAYVLRLSTGVKHNPSNAAIVRLFIALAMDPSVVTRDPTFIYGLEKLLFAAAATSTRTTVGRKTPQPALTRVS